MAQDDESPRPESDWTNWASAWAELLRTGGAAAAPWLSLSEHLWRCLEDADTGDVADNAERLREAIGEWRRAMVASLPPTRQLVGCLRGLLVVGIPAGGAADEWPHLGPFQHQQARWERITDALEAYYAALADHLDSLADIAQESVDAVADAVAASDGPENPRALFERWSAAAEARYEARLEHGPYPRTLADLTNRWSELRLALQPVIDELSESMGLPSRRQVDDTQAALDRLRRRQREENRRLRERLAALEARTGDPRLDLDNEGG